MKMVLNKVLKDFKRITKDTRGFGLLDAMFYVIMLVTISVIVLNMVANIYEKYTQTKYQEEFYKQQEQFFVALNNDTIYMDGDISIAPSMNNPKVEKMYFKTDKYNITIMQTSKGLIYKKEDLVTRKITSLNFDFITSTNFNRIDKVCLSNSSNPTDCYLTVGLIDIILRFEKRVVRNPMELKSGRVIYYD